MASRFLATQATELISQSTRNLISTITSLTSLQQAYIHVVISLAMESAHIYNLYFFLRCLQLIPSIYVALTNKLKWRIYSTTSKLYARIYKETN